MPYAIRRTSKCSIQYYIAGYIIPFLLVWSAIWYIIRRFYLTLYYNLMRKNVLISHYNILIGLFYIFSFFCQRPDCTMWYTYSSPAKSPFVTPHSQLLPNQTTKIQGYLSLPPTSSSYSLILPHSS